MVTTLKRFILTYKDTIRQVVGSVVKMSQEKSTPVIFALSRRKIGKILQKGAAVTMVAIIRTDGAETLLKKALQIVYSSNLSQDSVVLPQQPIVQT